MLVVRAQMANIIRHPGYCADKVFPQTPFPRSLQAKEVPSGIPTGLAACRHKQR